MKPGAERRLRFILASARRWKSFPLIVGALAVLSSATGLYPFMPVLVAAVAFAPSRWRVTYVASIIGSATGAALLACVVQAAGNGLADSAWPTIGTLPQWVAAEQLMRDYGEYALAMVAALPVPQIPLIVALAISGTSPWMVGAAVLVGKAAKYGVYVLGTEFAVAMYRRWRRRG